MKIIFCSATEKDMQQILQLEHAVQKNLRRNQNSEWFSGYCTYKRYKEFLRNSGKIYIAKHNGKIVACLGVMRDWRWNPWYRQVIGRLNNLGIFATEGNCLIIDFYFVHSNYRGKHLIQQLYNKFISDYKNFRYIVASTHKDNLASNKILCKLGLNYADDMILNRNNKKYYRRIYLGTNR